MIFFSLKFEYIRQFWNFSNFSQLMFSSLFIFYFFLCNVTSFADYLTFKILFNWPYNLYDFALCIHRTYAHTQICSNANISTYPTSWQVFPALQVHGETPVIEISSTKTSKHSLKIIVNYYQHIHTFLRLYFTVTTAAVGGCGFVAWPPMSADGALDRQVALRADCTACQLW